MSPRRGGKKRVRLVHWDEGQAEEKAEVLRRAGYGVDASPIGPEALRELKRRPPDAVVIVLDRLPVQGRDVGIVLRTNAKTRGVPIVFAGGEPSKVAKVKASLPDARYAAWSRIRSALKSAIARPPASRVVPSSVLAGYSGTPLARKLGIRENHTVILVGAPSDFESKLSDLPPGVRFRRRAAGRNDLIVWFCPSLRELRRRLARLKELAGRGGIWIAWPKKASGVPTDLTQAAVRKEGLDAGLVDYKICAIDSTWSGLRFARRN